MGGRPWCRVQTETERHGLVAKAGRLGNGGGSVPELVPGEHLAFVSTITTIGAYRVASLNDRSRFQQEVGGLRFGGRRNITALFPVGGEELLLGTLVWTGQCHSTRIRGIRLLAAGRRMVVDTEIVVEQKLLSRQHGWIGGDDHLVGAPARRQGFLFAGQSIGFHVDLSVDLGVFGSFLERDDDVGRRVLELEQDLLVVPTDDGLVFDLDDLVAVLDFAGNVRGRIELDVRYAEWEMKINKIFKLQ